MTLVVEKTARRAVQKFAYRAVDFAHVMPLDFCAQCQRSLVCVPCKREAIFLRLTMDKIESALLRQHPGDVPDTTERRCGYDQPQDKAPRRPALAAASFEFRDARLGKLKLL